MVVVCWSCYDFAARSLKRFICDTRSVHSHEHNFIVVCGINSCPRTYKKFSSFKRHLYHHKEIVDDNSVSVITEQSQPGNNFDNFTVKHLLCEENGSIGINQWYWWTNWIKSKRTYDKPTAVPIIYWNWPWSTSQTKGNFWERKVCNVGTIHRLEFKSQFNNDIFFL